MKPPGTSSALAGSAARAAEVPVAAIVQAGVARQAVCNWSAGYGQGHGLTVATGTHLASLPVQRPGWSRERGCSSWAPATPSLRVFQAVGTPQNSRSEG